MGPPPVFAAEDFGAADLAGLTRFLDYVRAAARESGRPRYAHIAMPCAHLDPLAVLATTYTPAEFHAYAEHPSGGWAVAGADAVAVARAAGPDRFARMRAFAEAVAADTMVARVGGAPANPRFFAAFAFGEEHEAGSVFPPATVFLPRWQVAGEGDRFWVAANVRVAPGDEVEPLARRIWTAADEFSAFTYGCAPEVAVEPVANRLVRTTEAGTRPGYEERVRAALKAMEQGAYRKIVLARACDVETARPFDALETVFRLRERFPDCIAFSFGNEARGSFIGATPEHLVRLHDGRLETAAIAGSAPRGRDARQDAQAARELLASAKDRHEHDLVVRSIVSGLQQLGLAPEAVPETPGLLRLANVQHLRTPLRAAAEGRHILDVAGVLHPTPAVGGSPREGIQVPIRTLEGFPRGLYAGVIGWFDTAGEGELMVALRSAYAEGCRARLYAGAGIVPASNPALEFAETEVKFRALRSALLSPASTPSG